LVEGIDLVLIGAEGGAFFIANGEEGVYCLGDHQASKQASKQESKKGGSSRSASIHESSVLQGTYQATSQRLYKEHIRNTTSNTSKQDEDLTKRSISSELQVLQGTKDVRPTTTSESVPRHRKARGSTRNNSERRQLILGASIDPNNFEVV